MGVRTMSKLTRRRTVQRHRHRDAKRFSDKDQGHWNRRKDRRRSADRPRRSTAFHRSRSAFANNPVQTRSRSSITSRREWRRSFRHCPTDMKVAVIRDQSEFIETFAARDRRASGPRRDLRRDRRLSSFFGIFARRSSPRSRFRFRSSRRLRPSPRSAIRSTR